MLLHPTEEDFQDGSTGPYVPLDFISDEHAPVSPAFKDIMINMAAKPTDLRVPANAIMDAANWLIKKLPKDQPLIILMGESHNYISEVALQQTFITTARKRHPDMPIAYGLEIDNTETVSEVVLGRFKTNLPILSPLTRMTGLNFMVKEGIPFSFNDAAHNIDVINNKLCLDLDNPQIKRLIKEIDLPELDKKPWIDVEDDPAGMAIRNAAIVENALTHLNTTKAKIYVQQCGLTHLAGDNSNSYEHSLHAHFVKAGMTVLSVIPKPLDDNFRQNMELRGALRHNTMTFSALKRLTDSNYFGIGEKDGLAQINAASGGILKLENI